MVRVKPGLYVLRSVFLEIDHPILLDLVREQCFWPILIKRIGCMRLEVFCEYT